MENTDLGTMSWARVWGMPSEIPWSTNFRDVIALGVVEPSSVSQEELSRLAQECKKGFDRQEDLLNEYVSESSDLCYVIREKMAWITQLEKQTQDLRKHKRETDSNVASMTRHMNTARISQDTYKLQLERLEKANREGSNSCPQAKDSVYIDWHEETSRELKSEHIENPRICEHAACPADTALFEKLLHEEREQSEADRHRCEDLTTALMEVEDQLDALRLEMAQIAYDRDQVARQLEWLKKMETEGGV